MRYDELIVQQAGDEHGEVNFAELAEQVKRRGFKEPSYTRLHHNGTRRDGPEEMPWGTTSWMRNAIKAPAVMGSAAVLETTPKIVWLSVGESIGLPDMFSDSDVDRAVVRLFPRWHALDELRFKLWNRVGIGLRDEQEAQERIAALEAENEQLRADLAKAQRASKRKA